MACCMKLIDDTGCMKLIDDTEPPSMLINSYAVFMGYLSMAIKGIGFLILTWTTVVLLGGFVSMIDTRDFWCLTFITLVQTAGIFDVYLNEKLSYILYSAIAFLGSPWFAFMGKNFSEEDFEKKFPVALIVRSWLACIFVVVQMLVFAILLCTLVAVYVFGVLISAGISLWRLVLVQHAYQGNLNETTNLKPALYTLYCLAIFQGALFLYRFTFARTGKNIAKMVFKCGDNELKAILTYLDETKIGCEKNPSFARGRNFITHAIELICSKSLDDCLSGVQLLYTSICIWERRLKAERAEKKFYLRQWNKIIRQHMLRKKLIVSASSSSVLQKVLLQTLNPQGTYNREMRNQAAKIVVYLAIDVHLEQFPHGIQYISTLIGTFEEYRLMEPYHIDRLIHKYDQDWDRQANQLPLPGPDNDKLREAYEKLVLQGLCILRKLATYENNCIIMSETQGLLPKIMAPLTSDLIHQFNGRTWSIMVVEASLKVMHLLVAAPGEAGARMAQKISNNKEAVRTMERILSCHYCHVKLQKQAMWMLIQLYMETKSMSTIIKMLGDIFVDSSSRDKYTRKLAGEALVKLCLQSGSNTSIILQVDGDVVGSLTNILLDVKNKTCRIRAAEILEHMCNIHHTQDDECLSKLKEAMTTTMPKVLAEILCYELSKDETQATIEANQIEVVVKEDDIENQCDDPQENAQDKTSSSTHPEYKENEEDVDIDEDESENEDEDEKNYAPLLSLCVKVCDTFIGADQDLACQFDTTSLPKKLEEMVKKNSIPVVSCLRLMKLTCKMVISMMNHSGSYDKDDLDSLMNALSSASESMCHLHASMVFANQDDGAPTMKPVRSLSSLMEEAKKSVEMRRAEHIMEASTSGSPRQLS